VYLSVGKTATGVRANPAPCQRHCQQHINGECSGVNFLTRIREIDPGFYFHELTKPSASVLVVLCR
jgi:hypothetical protein